jgi:hypothetical protein
MAPAPQGAPLPDPAALTDVVAALTDPAIPGKDKLTLIEGATAEDAEALDRFTKALSDNRMLPMTYTATELEWTDSTGGERLVANVTLTSSRPETPPFSFPMEFLKTATGWQLSRTTAEQLLTLGGS